LLLAPRKLKRVDEIVELIRARGLIVSRRTQPVPGADVFILDTLGELSLAYQFSVAAFVGGTLDGVGHNVIEPLVWGIPVAYGAGAGKSSPAQRTCEKAGVGFRVQSSEELAAHWVSVLRDEKLRSRLREQSTQLLEAQRGALERNVAAILELIDA
jgi:3-deoxy-D-manno-octulosonic-acid transferase